MEVFGLILGLDVLIDVVYEFVCIRTVGRVICLMKKNKSEKISYYFACNCGRVQIDFFLFFPTKQAYLHSDIHTHREIIARNSNS